MGALRKPRAHFSERSVSTGARYCLAKFIPMIGKYNCTNLCPTKLVTKESICKLQSLFDNQMLLDNLMYIRHR